MKSLHIAGAIALLATFSSLSAHADVGKTREQVRQEYFQAVKSGDLIVGDTGLTLREQRPSQYPREQSLDGKSRAQVKFETAQAIRNGDTIDESSLTVREHYPQRFPAAAQDPGKTREQVKAELAQAIRTGDIVPSGDGGQRLNELFPQRNANAHATSGLAAQRVRTSKNAEG